jgi:two-component system cell cycle sensor histidine kinase/response regulator CckA
MKDPSCSSATGANSATDLLIAQCASVLTTFLSVAWATDRDLVLTSVGRPSLPGTCATGNPCAGQPLLLLFTDPNESQKIVAAHRKALEGQRQSFAADVNGREFQAFVGPVCGPNGDVTGTAGFAVDATDRLVMNRALRISEYSYRSLIEDMPIAIFRCTASGRLLQVNRAMESMLGYAAPAGAAAEDFEPGELLLQDLPQIFLPGGFRELRQALAARPMLQGFESIWIRRDGSRMEVSLSGRASLDDSGEASCLDIVAQDITEKKQLEGQLRHAQRLQVVGQLAGGMAHDFNNLLTVIMGQSEILLRENREGSAQGRLRAVQDAAERAGALTRQMLAFSRRQVLQSQTLEINVLIDNFLGILKRLVNASINITFSAGNNAGCVLADPTQIEQVLMNLAVNARDAMPNGGLVEIETAYIRHAQPLPGPDALVAGDYVQITFRDSGHGMDAATKDRIFEPFYTTKAPGSGTGLGLSMVYGIVRQSGGQITVDSSQGNGATFTIWLPKVKPDENVVQSGHVLAEAPGKGCGTILVAEDLEAVRELVTGYLETLGYDVLSASDGKDALSKAAAHKGTIELLLTDLVMPGMGGRELAGHMAPLFPGAKVLFMSGYAGHADDPDMPGADFLAKPLSLDLLARRIRESIVAG